MPPTVSTRRDGRRPDELRPCRVQRGYLRNAPGSALIEIGGTRVLCGVTVSETVPRWMRAQNVPGGWITAEYSILPYATLTRTDRESTRGRVGGRTQEIQRLVGRCMRACCDLRQLGPRTVWVDCDVIEADGGTRMAAVTGAFVALQMALANLAGRGILESAPALEPVAGVSVGMVGGEAVLDLDHEEDAAADVDLNVVMTARDRIVELQGSAEGEPFSLSDLGRLIELARGGIAQLLGIQSADRPPAGPQ